MTNEELDAMIGKGEIAQYIASQVILNDEEFAYLQGKGLLSSDRDKRPLSMTEYLIDVLGIEAFKPQNISSFFASSSFVAAYGFLVLCYDLIPEDWLLRIASKGCALHNAQLARYEKLGPNDFAVRTPLEIAFMNYFYNVNRWCQYFCVKMYDEMGMDKWTVFGVARCFLIPYFKWSLLRDHVTEKFRKRFQTFAKIGLKQHG